MKQFRSIYMKLVITVFAIIAISNVITGASYLFILGQPSAPPFFIEFMRSPLLLLCMSLVIGTAISALVTRLMLKPMRQLIDATKKVAKGDFDVRVDAAEGVDEIAELVGSFNDMTKELGSTELFKKDFINSFSHEFKTPIVSIRGFAKQLKRDDLTDEQRNEYIDIIVQESERLTNMSANILLLTRLENQRIMTDRADYSLDEQLRNCILLLERQWSEKNIELDLNLSDLTICANEEMLSHVWINIIGNAIKFSKDGGKLSVTCALSGDSALVRISDNGIGMTKETRERIFDKFYQGEATGSSEPSHSMEGNGLGLPLAKRIIELSGGKISVSSKVNKGSDFVIVLPIGK